MAGDRSKWWAMISSEVERTLVKSPPELWAELSDPAALARHLGELGEIRIVRTESERTVEWAAENTTGTVAIKPSGWGTKVILSVTRELDHPPAAAEARPDAGPAIEPEPTTPAEPELTTPAARPEPEPTAPAEPELTIPAARAEPEPTTPAEPELTTPAARAEPEPTPPAAPELAATAEPQTPRRGFFARLFGRRRADAVRSQRGEDLALAPAPLDLSDGATVERPDEPRGDTAGLRCSPESPDVFAEVRRALSAETFTAADLFATQSAHGHTSAARTPEQETAGRAEDISAELMAAEAVAVGEVTAVLTAVLDRLGAAHHRPFSRA